MDKLSGNASGTQYSITLPIGQGNPKLKLYDVVANETASILLDRRQAQKLIDALTHSLTLQDYV